MRSILLGATLAPLEVARERLVDAIDDVSVAERLLYEIRGTGFHGRDGHRRVAMDWDDEDLDDDEDYDRTAE